MLALGVTWKLGEIMGHYIPIRWQDGINLWEFSFLFRSYFFNFCNCVAVKVRSRRTAERQTGKRTDRQTEDRQTNMDWIRVEMERLTVFSYIQ